MSRTPFHIYHYNAMFFFNTIIMFEKSLKLFVLCSKVIIVKSVSDYNCNTCEFEAHALYNVD